MNISPKIYLPAIGVAVVIVAFVITSLWSDHKIRVLERDVESAKATADQKASAANELEKQADAYKAKNEYLEQKLAELQAAATKQDEELKKLSKNVDPARRDVDRTRRVRSVATTADQLCAKLAELGHGCQ